MEKKKKIVLCLGIVALLFMNMMIVFHKQPVGGDYQVKMDVTADKPQELQLFYGIDKIAMEENSSTAKIEKSGSEQKIEFSVPFNTQWIRLDLGKESGEFNIKNLQISYKKEVEFFEGIEKKEVLETQQITEIEKIDNGVAIKTNGTDAYVWLPVETTKLYNVLCNDVERKTHILNILMLLFLDGGVCLAFICRKKIFTLPVELWQNRALILNLAKNDFKTKYAGSYLGIFWAFVQPIVTILVYWFVFSVGLKSGNVMNYPFVLYLVSGIVPWFFFQDALNSGTNALIEYNYLVKKVVFKISILPIVKIVSALFVHIFFMIFSLILCWLYGYKPGLHTIQIMYYAMCAFLFSLGLVYATSAIVIFFRDLTQIIGIILQVGVWMTPIMWDLNMLAGIPWLMKIFKLNPMYYIVSGYRDSMLGYVWFWEHWGWTLYFWIVTAVLFISGSVIFKRLKPHFADVL